MFSMIILDRNSKISNIKVLCHGLGGEEGSLFVNCVIQSRVGFV
jgi:predicted esterase